jgi:hypothetical protein
MIIDVTKKGWSVTYGCIGVQFKDEAKMVEACALHRFMSFYWTEYHLLSRGTDMPPQQMIKISEWEI